MPEARSRYLSKKTRSWRASGMINLKELHKCHYHTFQLKKASLNLRDSEITILKQN